METNVELRYNRGVLFYVSGYFLLIFAGFMLFGMVYQSDFTGASPLFYLLSASVPLLVLGNWLSYKDTFKIREGRIKQSRQYRIFGNRSREFSLGAQGIFYRLDKEGVARHLMVYTKFGNKILLVHHSFLSSEEYVKIENGSIPKIAQKITLAAGLKEPRVEKGWYRPIIIIALPFYFLRDLMQEI